MGSYEVLSLAVGAVSAAGSVMAGVGALWAVRQIRRHWNDDDEKLSCSYLDERRALGKLNCEVWSATVRVVNMGKVPASVVGFDYFGCRLRAKRGKLALDECVRPRLVMPGQAVDVTARCANLDPADLPAHVDGVRVRSARGASYDVARPAGFAVDVFGRKVPYDKHERDR